MEGRFLEFIQATALHEIVVNGDWRSLAMLAIGCSFIGLAVIKKYEPLLLLPIGFGILLGNIPLSSTLISPDYHQLDYHHLHDLLLGLSVGHFELDWKQLAAHAEFGRLADLLHKIAGGAVPVDLDALAARPEFPLLARFGEAVANGRIPVETVHPTVLDLLYRTGIRAELFPPLIFLGVGAMTDFSFLISNPRLILLGAAAQAGIFFTFLAAMTLGFAPAEAGSIGIIGGADGPTAIFLTSKLAPHLLAVIAISAYSYMAMVPIIQPPIIRLLTTRRERRIEMKPPREVSKTERILFPIVAFIICVLVVPAASILLGMLLFGNLLRESGVTDRLADTAKSAFIDIVTILLGICVGASAKADVFLTAAALKIFLLGIVAFMVATAAGVLLGKLMNRVSRDPVNPIIGAAGVSAVPMAARVCNVVGQEENPGNFLLMHAMAPNVAGVIGSAVAAGILLALVG